MKRRNTSRILAACIVIAVLVISTSWVVAKLDPFPIMLAKGLHENAAFLALSICPMNECDSHLGWGTKELPIDTSEQILQKWCVEVFYTKKQTKEKGKAAVEIGLINRDDDNPNNWKIVNTQYGADCSAMK